MVNGQWSMVNGQWSMDSLFAFHHSLLAYTSSIKYRNINKFESFPEFPDFRFCPYGAIFLGGRLGYQHLAPDGAMKKFHCLRVIFVRHSNALRNWVCILAPSGAKCW